MGYCHKLVKSVAQGIAGAAYDQFASESNDFYRQHPKQKRFVLSHWQHFVDPARRQLGEMLGMSTVPEHMKAEILDALLKDNTAPSGGKHREVMRH